jgi:hypothetical protein
MRASEDKIQGAFLYARRVAARGKRRLGDTTRYLTEI